MSSIEAEKGTKWVYDSVKIRCSSNDRRRLVLKGRKHRSAYVLKEDLRKIFIFAQRSHASAVRKTKGLYRFSTSSTPSLLHFFWSQFFCLFFFKNWLIKSKINRIFLNENKNLLRNVPAGEDKKNSYIYAAFTFRSLTEYLNFHLADPFWMVMKDPNCENSCLCGRLANGRGYTVSLQYSCSYFFLPSFFKRKEEGRIKEMG